MKYRLKIPFYLAWQYINRGRKWTLILTIFLLSAAFVNLLFISSLFGGVVSGADQKIRDTTTGDIYITPKQGEETIDDVASILSKLNKIDGVKATSSNTLVPGALTYDSITGQGSVYAIEPSDDKSVRTLYSSISPGNWLEDDDAEGIILGRQIAGGDNVEDNAFSFKGAEIGDKITLTIGQISKEFTVRGILYTKYIVTDQVSYITQAGLKSMLSEYDDKTSSILVKLDDNAEVDTVIDKIKSKNLPIEVYSWEDVNGLMSTVSSSFVTIDALMTTVGIVIAAITVFIVIYVDILHKRRQIGIFEAIGVNPSIIIFSYLLLAAFYAIVGILFGTVVFNFAIVPYFDAHPLELSICDARLVISGTEYAWRSAIIFIVSIISGLVPSLIATRGKMLDAILGKQ